MTAGARAHLLALAASGATVAALLAPAQPAFAEGSVNFNTGGDTSQRLTMMQHSSTNAPYNNGYVVLRAYAEAGETIQMGSSAMGLGGTIADIRVYAPGTSFVKTSEPSAKAPFPSDPVFTTHDFSCVADDPGTGRIASRAEENAGPLPSPGGYDACEYVAPAAGAYAIVMFPYSLTTSSSASSVGSPNVSTTQNSSISIWDVTVRDGGVVRPGRLFSNILRLQPWPFGTASNYAAFVYTPAGHVYRLRVFGPQGAAQDLAVNGAGVIDAATGQPTFASFQWANKGGGYPATPAPEFTEALAPQMYAGDAAADSRYPIFFQSPDPVAIGGPGGLAETRGYANGPWAPEGGLSQALSFTGASGQSGATTPGAGGTVHVDAPPLQGLAYTLAIDLDENGSFGGGGDVEDAGVLAPNGNDFAWDGRDASGAAVPCGTYAYKASSSLPTMHVVQSDTETEAGIEIERLTLPGDPLLGDPKAAAYNDVDPYKAIAVTNASPSAVAEGISGPTFHGWSGSTGHTDFVDTWVPVRQTSGSGTFTVNCPSPRAELPGATSPEKPVQAKQPKPVQAKQPTPKGPKGKKAPRLVLEKVATSRTARPGAVVAYRITVANRGDAPARGVRVCDHPPPAQRTLRTEPRADRKAKPCWRLARLAPGAERSFTLTAMVKPGSDRGTQRNRATVTAANVKGVRADTAAVGVRPLPQTGCLAGPSSVGSLPEIDFLC